MTVLLVDDQIRILSGLISGLDWDALEVSSIRTASPGPSLSASSSTPWCRSMISLAMDRPSPVPPDWRDRALSTR